MRLTLAALLAAAVAPAAQAQVTPLELGLALCRAVPDKDKRLACFDTVTDPKNRAKTQKSGKPDVLSGVPVAREHAAWEFQESKSPIDDSPQLDALLAAEDGAGGLALRCREQKTEAIVMPKGFVGLSLSGGGMRVQYRIGSQPVRESRWPAATNGQAVFVPSPIPFIRSLPDNTMLFVRVFDFQGARNDVTLHLRDVSTARARLAQACRWPQR